MMALDELKQQLMQSPSFKQAYDALEDEFRFVGTLIDMRQKAGLSQEALAAKMGVKKSHIIRIESDNGNPGWKALQRYAQACGFKVQLHCERLGEV